MVKNYTGNTEMDIEQLKRELKTTPLQRMEWLTRAVRFAMCAADEKAKKAFIMQCRGDMQ